MLGEMTSLGCLCRRRPLDPFGLGESHAEQGGLEPSQDTIDDDNWWLGLTLLFSRAAKARENGKCRNDKIDHRSPCRFPNLGRELTHITFEFACRVAAGVFSLRLKPQTRPS